MLSTDTLSFSAYTVPTVVYRKTLWNCLQILMSYCLIINQSQNIFKTLTHTIKGSVFFYFAISLPAKVHSHCRLRENSHSHGVEECIPQGTSVTHSSKATQATYNPPTFFFFLQERKQMQRRNQNNFTQARTHFSLFQTLARARLHCGKPTQVQTCHFQGRC